MKFKKNYYQRIDEAPPEYQNLSVSHNDAGEGVFFARELEHIKAKSYDIKFPFLKARKILPLSFDTNAGATRITYQQYTQVGMAKIIANYADDLPRADVLGKEFSSPVREIGSSYGYNIKEIASAKMAGKPLNARRANAAKRSCMVRENNIAFNGDSVSGLKGFLNAENISEVVLDADGMGNSKEFSKKTADNIIRDITRLPTHVHTVSKGVEIADTLLLPLSQYNLISNLRLPDTNISVRKWILAENPHLKKIDWLDELRTAGAGNTARMMVYRYDPDALTLEITQEFSQRPVQEKGLEFTVPCWMGTGGVIVYYPLSIAYADGI